MTDPVFVVPDLVSQLARVGESGAFTLPDAEARHASVKRMRQGEPVVLTDGSGFGVAGHWTGDGTVAGGHRIAGRDPRPRVTVVQAIPKSERAELAVDLAVQAGADRIIPWQADRCVSRWTGGKGGKSDKSAKAHARWSATAVAAMKQSRRLSGAHVGDLLTDIGHLQEHLASRPWDVSEGADPPTVRVLVLHEEAATPLAQVDLDVDEVVLVIGPEGGVSDREINAVTSAHDGREAGQSVVLGPEVLRTATAAAVALGAIGVLTTRWSR
ncbi:16S rRNA (uracil(1498)-N(3))-methyltransferase [Corynebacterium glyciniphilum]|uniref:16S rRNA (uracil(1498)-N(3))-methyltransferase n=1 Tax=Corynebacterium glyciniphilum TaxID=1404244 RepID=UPI0023578C32